jgi:AcrR family transcriptional regulator
VSVRENRSGRHTKEWILETACRLFNEHGSQAVSTKRIAKEMGISPGNLYYHFKNKEEIIRALLQNRMETFTDEWNSPQISPLERFLDITNKVMLAWQECLFFKKELVVLLNKDPELKKLYRKKTETIVEKGQLLFQELVQSGMLHTPDDPKVFESFLTISTIIVEYWLTFLELNDEPITEENLRKGVDLIIQLWCPYLSEEALAELNQLKENFKKEQQQ